MNGFLKMDKFLIKINKGKVILDRGVKIEFYKR